MELNRRLFMRLLLLVALSAMIVWAVFHGSAVWNFVKQILALVNPFIIGLALAFVVTLLLRPIEQGWDLTIGRRWKGKWATGLKRPVCMVLSGVILAGVAFVLAFIILPEVVATVSSIVDMLPSYISTVQVWWTELSEQLLEYGIVLPQPTLDGAALGAWVRDFITERGAALFGRTVGITTSIVAWIVNLLIAFVFCIYVLAQKETLARQARNLLFAYLPEQVAEETIDVASLSGNTFAKFVTGQLTEAVIIGILCFLGMLILSIPYATTVSVLVGVTSLIPVVGALLGTAVGALLILMVEPMKAVWFVLFIIVLQQFEGNVIYPRVMGKSVGLPGIWVLVAITIGGSLFGLLGMLLSVPIASVLYTLLRRSVQARLARK